MDISRLEGRKIQSTEHDDLNDRLILRFEDGSVAHFWAQLTPLKKPLLRGTLSESSTKPHVPKTQAAESVRPLVVDETYKIIKNERVSDVQMESSNHGSPDILRIFTKEGGELMIQAIPNVEAGADPGVPVRLDISYMVD